MTDDPHRQLSDLKQRFDRECADVRDGAGLEALRTRYLGRKQGELTHAMKALRELSEVERRETGQRLNALKGELEAALESLEAVLVAASAEHRQIDLSLPGRRPPRGARHPIEAVRLEIEAIFRDLGYEVAEGPEVDDDFHCFEALNLPPDHPARDMQDTLYVEGDVVLRPHTSNVQIHVLETRQPPIQIIAPGRVFRRDTPDLTHSPVFHQIEALLVAEGIHFGHLKGTLEHFSKRLFGEATRTRLRPSFFPFTEPSAELDISCVGCGGPGCALCKHSGWIELLGCGMVDPNVLATVHIDPERFSGFAFGLGIERAAMLKYGIDNIRLLYDNDLRFLTQFAGIS